MKNLIAAFFLTVSFFSFSQEKDFAKLMHDPDATFEQKQQAFNAFFKGKDTKEKGKGWKQFKRWEYMQRDRVDNNGFSPDPTVIYTEWKKAHAQFENKNLQNKSGNNSTQTVSSWQYIGPPNGISTGTGAGRLCFITFDPTTPTTMFVGSPGGGLWKSTNSGANWTVVNDMLPNLGAAHLAIDPTNSNVMYLSTGDRDATDNYSIGLLKSSDGGLTWNTTGLSYVVSALQHVNCVLIDPTNTQVLYAATSQGVFKSIDAGTNWVASKPGNYQDLKFKPTDPNTIYVCGSGGFAHTANAGTTWTNGSFPSPTGSLGRVAMAVTAANSTIVYVLAGQGSAQSYGFAGFYKSTNSGTSFTKVCSSPNLLGWNTTGSDAGGQAWYDLIVAANPTNANEVICGGVNTWRTTNGGTSFSLFTHWTGGGGKPYVHADCHAIEYSPIASTKIFIGCDGGLYSTSNSGTSFAMSSSGLQIGQQYRLGVSQTSPNLTLTGWQDNGCSLTNQGTSSTKLVLGGDGMEVAIDPTTSSVMFGEQYNGNIYKSSNGGTNFGNIVGTGGTAGTVDEDGDWVTPYVIDPNNPNTLYVGKSEIYQSTDGGATYTALTALGGGNFTSLAVAPSNSNYVYGAKGGSLWYTSNGSTFTAANSPGAITYLCVDPANPVRIWATTGGYSNGAKVFYSNDSGTTWTNISLNLPNLPTNCIAYQPGSSDGLYVGTDIGVYYKDNSLPNWVFYSNSLPNVIVKELEFQISTMKLRAATYGRGLWQIDPYSTPTAAPVAAFSSNKTSLCVGGNVNFYDNSTNLPYAWSWTFTGGNPSTSNQQSPSGISYSAAGTYPVKLVSTNGTGSDSTTVSTYITVLPGPTILTHADTSICRGDTIQLYASGGTQYSWSPSNWLSNTNISNPKSWAYNTKTYTVTAIGPNGCTGSSAVKVSVIPVPSNPIIYANADSLCCSPATGVHYQWYLNGTLQVGDTMHCLHISQNGAYYCQITDTSVCQYKFNSAVNNYNSVNVKSFASERGIEIYPNPAQVSNGMVNIKFQNSKKYDVRVFSVKGDLVFEQQIQAAANTAYPLKFNLQSGMYFIHVGDETKKQVYTIQKLTIIE